MHVRLPRADLAALARYARQNDRIPAQEIRRAVRMYLEMQRRRETDAEAVAERSPA